MGDLLCCARFLSIAPFRAVFCSCPPTSIGSMSSYWVLAFDRSGSFGLLFLIDRRLLWGPIWSFCLYSTWFLPSVNGLVKFSSLFLVLPAFAFSLVVGLDLFMSGFFSAVICAGFFFGLSLTLPDDLPVVPLCCDSSDFTPWCAFFLPLDLLLVVPSC